MKVTLIKKIKNASDVFSFVFKPENPVEWKAGQYIFYKIPHPNPDNRGIIRHFTISSAPYEKNLMLTTRFPQGRISTFKQALNNLAIGSEIETLSMGGDFIVENPDKNYVFITGGIGITPYRSILLDLAQKNFINNIILLYVNRNEEIIFKDEFDALTEKHSGLKIKYIIEPERINVDSIKKEVPDFLKYNFYVSGTELMVAAIRKILIGMQINNEQVKSDFFPNYTENL